MELVNGLRNYIGEKSFPCIMAKALLKQGILRTCLIKNFDDVREQGETLKEIYRFIEIFKQDRNKLCSFMIFAEDEKLKNFGYFEESFWKFLSSLSQIDHQTFPHDQSVSSDPTKPNFSYSLGSEAFFILALHPQSERIARRFHTPVIVFNPHFQFEKMRSNGVFKKIRNTIRKRDLLLQDGPNSMLEDFGVKSEVYQYLAKSYHENDSIPLAI